MNIKLLKNKKGMDISGLYDFVLLIVLIGLILGVGILVLDKFSQSPAIGNASQTALNYTIEGLAQIPKTWLGLIILIAVVSIILTMVISAFFFRGGVSGRK